MNLETNNRFIDGAMHLNPDATHRIIDCYQIPIISRFSINSLRKWPFTHSGTTSLAFISPKKIIAKCNSLCYIAAVK